MDYRKSTINAETLLKKEFPPTNWVSPGIIPTGLTLMCAAPKAGKSWWALQIAREMVDKGSDVLALFLEDAEPQLQARLQAIQIESGKHLTLATSGSWSRLNEGGFEALRDWLQDHPNAGLIIIDTLAAVKPISKGRSAYDEDYASLSNLKKLCAEFPIGIVVLHHTRKMPSLDDPFAEISGTYGLTAVVDTAMVFKRDHNSNKAKLITTGRIAARCNFDMEWLPDAYKFVFTPEDDQEATEKTEIGKRIMQVLEAGSMTSFEIVSAMPEINPSTLRSKLSRMVACRRLIYDQKRYYLSSLYNYMKQ